MKYHNPVNTTVIYILLTISHPKKNKNKFWSIGKLYLTESCPKPRSFEQSVIIQVENNQNWKQTNPIFSRWVYFLNFRTIGKFCLKTLIYEVFLEFSYDEGLRSYIIKTFWWFLVEGDQIYLRYHSTCVAPWKRGYWCLV